jgi:hypothetical protein
MTVKPAQDSIIESWRIYNQIMFSKEPIETKREILEQSLSKEEIDKVQELILDMRNDLTLSEFLNQFPQQEEDDDKR